MALLPQMPLAGLAAETFVPEVGREIYWNVDYIPFRTLVIGLLGLVPLVMIVRGLQARWAAWRKASNNEPLPPRTEWGMRARRVLDHAFLQRRVRRRAAGGRSHVAIFLGFLLLFLGTATVAFQADFAYPALGIYFLQGDFYKFFSLTLEIAGLIGIWGCAVALHRRYVAKPANLGGSINWTYHLWMLLVILVSGFLIEGARLAGTDLSKHGYEKWASFVGYFFSLAIPEAMARSVHGILWWGHFAIALYWLGQFGVEAMSHVFTLCANIFLARDIPAGATPRPIADMENATTFGVLTIDQFAGSHLRDVDACVECGRCTDVCPAANTGKPLSPKKIINAIRDTHRRSTAEGGNPQEEFTGTVITADEIWSCTTCGACEQECPAMIEQVEKIVEMRRGLVLMKSEFPAEAQTAFGNLEAAGNPWGKAPEERAAWTSQVKDFQVPIWGEPGSEDAEYLFWVGCAGSYDARGIPISVAIATLMHQAGIKYAILGPRESCTGDSPLRMGHEYLYQILAKQNIETLKSLNVKKIVAQCPHCFQTLNKDYRLLDPTIQYEVIHHSDLLSRLLEDGRIKGGKVDANAILHDSCYLARHNKIEEQPRAVAKAALGNVAVSEPSRCRDKGMCCGAGGGRMWMEEKLGHAHVNEERSRELLKDGADMIVTSCPFCKTMMTDGSKTVAEGKTVRVMDVAELLLESQKK